MIMDFKHMMKKYQINPSGIIQIGSNEAQEDCILNELGIKKKIYIEPCQKAFNILSEKFGNNEDIILFNCACGEKSEVKTMFIESSNNGQSNSLLKPLLHEKIYPSIVFDKIEQVRVSALDDLDYNRIEYDLLMMDCQGCEGLIVKGAKESLKHINWIYTEVMTKELYENCTLLPDFDLLLPDFGRIETQLTECYWGDALYKRKDIK